jgi:hypothetical protein
MTDLEFLRGDWAQEEVSRKKMKEAAPTRKVQRRRGRKEKTLGTDCWIRTWSLAPRFRALGADRQDGVEIGRIHVESVRPSTLQRSTL